MENGYADGILCGHRNALLSQSHYYCLMQCNTLEDIRTQLAATQYRDEMLSSEPLTIESIKRKIRDNYVRDFQYLQNNSIYPLKKFLDFITYGYMIDNIDLLISGTLRNRNMEDIVLQCHPLGKFEAMATLPLCNNLNDLFNVVLIETPLAQYISDVMFIEEFTESNLEIFHGMLYKAYLEHFASFCMKQKGLSSYTMSEILNFEADCRAIKLATMLLRTDLPTSEKMKFFPNMGQLWPQETKSLSCANDLDQIQSICRPYKKLSILFDTTESYDIEKRIMQQSAKLSKDVFLTSMNLGHYYSYTKLREQEIKNIIWIIECITQNQRNRASEYIQTL